jgi:predicted transcriptional regulator
VLKKSGRPSKDRDRQELKFRTIREISYLTGWAENTVRKYLHNGVAKIKANGGYEAMLEIVHAVHEERVGIKAGSVECQLEYVQQRGDKEPRGKYK